MEKSIDLRSMNLPYSIFLICLISSHMQLCLPHFLPPVQGQELPTLFPFLTTSLLPGKFWHEVKVDFILIYIRITRHYEYFLSLWKCVFIKKKNLDSIFFCTKIHLSVNCIFFFCELFDVCLYKLP